MYKFLKQNHYGLPIQGLYEVQIFDQHNEKINYSSSTVDQFEKLVGVTFICDFKEYKVLTVLYDSITDTPYVLCKIIRENV